MEPSNSQRRHRQNINEAGHAHELTWSCYQGYPFLGRERCCLWLVDAIQQARETFDFDIWAWVFMPNHVHIIVHPRRKSYDIATIRQRIKEPVARQALRWLRENESDWLPRLQRQRGKRLEHLFWQSGGGYDRNITEGTTLLKMINYIHENPVRKELVTRGRDWKWSSAAWYVDQSEVPIIPDAIPPDWLE
ncbi:MAG: transposase [Planctomycetaceae bacterium]